MPPTTSDINLEDNQQKMPLEATFPFEIIAVVAVMCRFISGRIQDSKYEFDDNMILVDLICTLECFILLIGMFHIGSINHLVTVAPANRSHYFKVLVMYLKLTGYCSRFTFTTTPFCVRT